MKFILQMIGAGFLSACFGLGLCQILLRFVEFDTAVGLSIVATIGLWASIMVLVEGGVI